MVDDKSGDPWSYETTRVVFKIICFVGDFVGLVSFALLLTWICKYGQGVNWTTGQGLENTHILLMSFFMVFLQGNGSIIYRLLPTTPKYTAKLIHAGIHFSACIGITFGFVAILEQHRLNNAPNFKSLHSWLGLVTVACYYLQFIFGFSVYLYPSEHTEFKVTTLPIHKVIGRTLFLFAVTACVTGIMQEAVWIGDDYYASLPENGVMLNFAGFFAVVFVASMIYILGDPIFRRRHAPFPHTIPGSMGQPVFYGSTTGSSPLPGSSSSLLAGIGRYEKSVY